MFQFECQISRFVYFYNSFLRDVHIGAICGNYAVYSFGYVGRNVIANVSQCLNSLVFYTL